MCKLMYLEVYGMIHVKMPTKCQYSQVYIKNIYRIKCIHTYLKKYEGNFVQKATSLHYGTKRVKSFLIV